MIGYLILAAILLAIAAWPVWAEVTAQRERQALFDDREEEDNGRTDATA